MRLPDILDLYSKFHYITYKEPDWSVVDWGCSCVACLRDCVCSHTILVGMFFTSSLHVPDSLEQTVPTVRKNAMLKRGIAGSKRKRWLAAKALETKKVFKKSRLLHVVGPKVRILTRLNSCIIVPHTFLQDSGPVPDDAPAPPSAVSARRSLPPALVPPPPLPLTSPCPPLPHRPQ